MSNSLAVSAPQRIGPDAKRVSRGLRRSAAPAGFMKAPATGMVATALKQFPFFLAVLILAGCTPIATVKPTTPQYAAVGNLDPALAVAENRLQDAANLKASNPLHAVGDYLASAQAAADRLRQHPDDKQARALYTFAVARSIEVIEVGRLNPWDRALKVPSPAGEYTLTNVRHGGPEYNPGNYELIPNDTIVLGGTYLDRHVTVDGIGAPTVAVGNEE